MEKCVSVVRSRSRSRSRSRDRQLKQKIKNLPIILQIDALPVLLGFEHLGSNPVVRGCLLLDLLRLGREEGRFFVVVEVGGRFALAAFGGGGF